MKKQDEFLLNECFVLSGFVLSLNNYEIAGIMMGLFSAAFAMYSLHINLFKKDWKKVLLISFLQLLLLEISYLNQMFPSLYILSVCSLVVSFVWSHAGYKAICYGMKWMNGAALFFTIAWIVMPYHTYTLFQTLLIISFIFFPSGVLYFFRQMKRDLKRMHRQKKMPVVE